MGCWSCGVWLACGVGSWTLRIVRKLCSLQSPYLYFLYPCFLTFSLRLVFLVWTEHFIFVRMTIFSLSFFINRLLVFFLHCSPGCSGRSNISLQNFMQAFMFVQISVSFLSSSSHSLFFFYQVSCLGLLLGFVEWCFKYSTFILSPSYVPFRGRSFFDQSSRWGVWSIARSQGHLELHSVCCILRARGVADWVCRLVGV